MQLAEVYPLASIGDSGPYPLWIRRLRHLSGVYVIRDLFEDTIGYVGESHSNRLYSTLTRHFQNWSNKYDTAGFTYDRDIVEVAVIVVPKDHAWYLQNELICALEPIHNRLTCEQLFDLPDDDDELDDFDKNDPPPGYDYDIDLLIEGIAYQWPNAGEDFDNDVPF